MNTYVFPGLRPYIDAAATAAGKHPQHLGRGAGIWHCTQIQDSLGQLPKLAGDRGPLLAHAKSIRDELAMVLAGIDAAISEVSIECGLVPEADKKPIKRRA
jgi:hypothetical protein